MSAATRTVVALACGLASGVSLTHLFGAHAADDSESALPYDSLRLFTEAMQRVKADYVEPVSDERLMQGALRGMIGGLEPHSRYLDADEFRDMTVTTTGAYSGVGLEVQYQDGTLRVVSPNAGGPAEAAGIRAGDSIVAIDGAPVEKMTFTEAVHKLRGAVGTSVTMTVRRSDASATMQVRLQRSTIKLANVTSRLLGPGIGYVRVASFTTEAARSMHEHITELARKSSGSQLSGLILDLRNNPGGVLNSAVAMADEFLDGGVIVTRRGRAADANQVYEATPGDVLHGKPLVVVVNGGSASASEVLAGALQDRRRALLVGTRTFGKGLVQSVLPMREGDAVVLTTARYFTPSGRSIQAEGITPDVELQSVTLAKAEKMDSLLREADLKNRLAPEAGTPATQISEASEDADLAQKDYALYESLTALKGMIAYRPVS